MNLNYITKAELFKEITADYFGQIVVDKKLIPLRYREKDRHRVNCDEK